MTIDVRGIEYDPFLPSVSTADGAVFHVLTGETSEETGLPIVDMVESARRAAEHDAIK